MKKPLLRRFLRIIGPGFITGASDDDPSGIGTYAQTGAMFGYSQLWTAFFSFPFMTVIQEMCGRIGLVTGKGLAGVIKSYYPRYLMYLSICLLALANILNIGADLGAMASSAELIIGMPFQFWLVIFVAICVILQVYIPYKTYSNYLKYLSFGLVAYVFAAILVTTDWGALITAIFIPNIDFSEKYIMNLVAILGTTISPYLFFWQTDEEVEEEISAGKIKDIGVGKPRICDTDISNMRLDTVIGMLFSNIIMLFIMATSASTLNFNGITHIETADQAAAALRPFAGNFAYMFFASGIIGTGLLAVPILSGSVAYAVSESQGWKAGLSKKFSRAKAFYITIIVMVYAGFLLNFLGIAPFKMLYYSAVINGVVAPPLMILILLIAGNKKIMGKHVNGFVSNIAGWGITLLMISASVLLLLFSL